jgi:membrane-bound ClpP family serine protease
MAANNTAALAALKAARNSVYAELAAHNNIDTTARAADWADVTDALQTKLEDLVHSIASLSKPTATPTSEPRNSSVRSDVP